MPGTALTALVSTQSTKPASPQDRLDRESVTPALALHTPGRRNPILSPSSVASVIRVVRAKLRRTALVLVTPSLTLIRAALT